MITKTKILKDKT